MAKKPFAIALVLLALCLSFSSLARAQGTTSRVTGTVSDSSGAAISGATITLINEATGNELTTESSDSGAYTFDLIQPGTYSVAVEKAGFKRFLGTKNAVLVNQPTTLNVALEIGGVAETVTVEGAAEQVQTSTSGNVGATIEQRTLESVPIVGARGRNPLDLLNYQPGIVNGANTGGGVHVHGSRDRSFNFTLDGIDINEASAGGSNFTPLRPNPDSIQEFQIVTSNFTAELGRSSGAQVTFVTRSGTNRFTGNLFEYYQTPDFLANPYENNTLGVRRPQFIQHIFGGSAGGPLFNPGFGEGTNAGWLKDRAFFFVNLQLLRQSQGQLVQRTVYTEAARSGLFRYVANGRNAPFGTAVSASTFPTGAAVNASGTPVFGNCPGTTPTSPCIATYNVGTNPSGIGIDQDILDSINLAPLPNDFTRGDGLNTAGYNFLAPTSERQYDFVSKFDFRVNDANQFYVRYAQGNQTTTNDSGNGGLQPFPTVPGIVDTFRKPRNLAINYRVSPSAKITNEFIFGYSDFSFFFGTENNNVPFILNLTTDAGTNIRGNGRAVRTYQFVDNVTVDLGRHLVKMGLNFRFGRQTDDRSEVAGGRIEGTINFSRTINNNFNAFGLPGTANGINANDTNTLRSQINDYLGRVGAYNQAFVASPDGSSFMPAGTRWQFSADYPEYDFYIQDTWKLRPNLTVDLGVRWEPKFAPTSDGLPVLRPNQAVTLGSAPSNTLRWEEGELFSNDLNNFSPSVGFAWDPFKKGKTSVRANYRLAYDRFGTQLFASALFQNAPGNNTLFPSTNTFGQGGGLYRNIQTIIPTGTPDQLRQPGAIGSLTQTVMDPDLVFPEIHQWFAGFQHEVGWNSVLEVNYIGKKGVHLFGGYDANQVDIFNNGFLAAFNDLKANRTTAGYQNAYFNALLLGDSRITVADGSATRMLLRVFPTEVLNGSVAGLAGSLAGGTGTQRVWQANSGNPYFFQKYPQFSVLNVLDSNDYSFYNALEIIMKRRITNGIGFQVGYTFAKSMDTRSFDPLFTTVGRGSGQSASSSPFDNRDRSLNYALSDFDRRHALQATYTIDLPVGKGRKFASDLPWGLDWIIGGWQLAGTLNLASGRPFTVYSAANTLSNVVVTPANCNGCTPDMGAVIQDLGTNYYFTAEQRALFSTPEPGEFGNTGRNFFIGPKQFQTDASLSKKFRFTERFSFDLRVDAKNLTNDPSFANPNAILNATAPFGRIRESVVSSARRIQFGGRFNF